MIKSFEVKNLNSKISDKFYFNEDLNILTGKNGCGKIYRAHSSRNEKKSRS